MAKRIDLSPPTEGASGATSLRRDVLAFFRKAPASRSISASPPARWATVYFPGKLRRARPFRCASREALPQNLDGAPTASRRGTLIHGNDRARFSPVGSTPSELPAFSSPLGVRASFSGDLGESTEAAPQHESAESSGSTRQHRTHFRNAQNAVSKGFAGRSGRQVFQLKAATML